MYYAAGISLGYIAYVHNARKHVYKRFAKGLKEKKKTNHCLILLFLLLCWTQCPVCSDEKLDSCKVSPALFRRQFYFRCFQKGTWFQHNLTSSTILHLLSFNALGSCFVLYYCLWFFKAKKVSHLLIFNGLEIGFHVFAMCSESSVLLPLCILLQGRVGEL